MTTLAQQQNVQNNEATAATAAATLEKPLHWAASMVVPLIGILVMTLAIGALQYQEMDVESQTEQQQEHPVAWFLYRLLGSLWSLFPAPSKFVYLILMRPVCSSYMNIEMPRVLVPSIPTIWTPWFTSFSFMTLMSFGLIVLLYGPDADGHGSKIGGCCWILGVFVYYNFPGLVGNKVMVYLLETYIYNV